MQLDTSLDWIPDLTSAIETSPLIVTPETPLNVAISMISQAHYSHQLSLATDLQEFDEQSPQLDVRTSCVLVKQNQGLVGTLTARDVVRLTAKKIDFQNATVGKYMTSPVITMPQRSVEDIFAVLFLFRRYQIRHLPLVDDQGQLIGVISHAGIQHILRPANLLRFRRVSDIMSTDVISANLDTSILDLAHLMSKHRVSCVVITQEGNNLPVGIVTERDIVQFHAFELNLATTQAQVVMSTPLFLLSPEDSLWTAHQEMQKRRVGRMVVSWNWGENLGIVTQTSLLRIFDPTEMYGVIDNMQQTIQQLQKKEFSPNIANQFPSLTNPRDSNLRSADLESLVSFYSSEMLSVYRQLRDLIDNRNLSAEDLRSQLQSVITYIQPFCEE